MASKETLLEQFTASYDENGWFVALRNALEGLTAEEARWKPEELDNSIWEIVNHLSFWSESWLARFRGETFPKAPDNDATFKDNSEADWQNAKEKLFRVLADWKTALGETDESKLDETVSEKYDEPWFVPVANLTIHNAYHIGQIIILRKLQGSWDRSKGVS
ncbi:MAG: DinB family protein [Pyrinomonadaceae bacterium]